MKGRMGGFSLIELLVALAIAGTLMAVGYPRLAGLAPVYRLEGATRNLAATLQKVRFRAIAENRCFQVTFDATAKTYQLQKKAASPGCTTSTYANEGVAQKIDDANTISITAPGSPGFDARGGAVSGLTLTLQSTTGGTRLVAVSTTGRIVVQ